MHYGPNAGFAFSGLPPALSFPRFYHKKRHGNLTTGAAMMLNLGLAVNSQEKDDEAITGII